MKQVSIIKSLLLSTALTGLGISASAQTSETDGDDEIITVGTQIKGADIAGILPVTSLDVTDIELTGAVSGDELLASIPQLGDVNFTETNFGAGVNDARGDVGSINLRGVGDGNTLVLLNGRRMVNHPGTKAVNQTPVTTVNSNAIPVTGIQRLEVLRDGASAVYGTDAVAGVINTVLDTDYDGLQIQLQYGSSEGTSLDETSGTIKWGTTFNEDRTNIAVFGNFMLRNGMPATDLRNSAQEDLRPFFEGTIYEGDTDLRNISSDTPWGSFGSVSGEDVAGIGDDFFHIQPDTESGCLVTTGLPANVCADNGTSISTNIRLDRARYRDLVGDTDRYNFFTFLNHELDNGMEVFGEASYYYADFTRRREMAQILTSQRLAIGISEEAFYNEFGTDLAFRQFRPIDAGQRETNVKNTSSRVLGGLRGDWGNWDWEAALLHSKATTEDVTNRVSLTLFEQAVNRTDPSAYNPFAAGNVTDTSAPGTFNADVIDSFMVDVRRDGTTALTLADAKVSNPSLFSTKAGDVGAAFGVEWRHEYFEDDRDPRLDGSVGFRSPITGISLPSDVMGSSPTPDTEGDRDVFSAFAELAIPLISPEMDFALAHSFDVQLAARAEDYSDFGSVIKPKIAASWRPFEKFQIRGAYSEGFRAPNLEQVNAMNIRRVNTSREDWILCEAIARSENTTFTDDNDCDNFGTEGVRNSDPNLGPENNKNYSLGVTFEPVSNITLTADWWRIEQEDIVGIFSDQNEISLDYLLRIQGSFNPNVVRGTPDDDLGDLFEANGLDRSGAGEIIEVRQTFTNLEQRDSEGIDFGAYVDFDTRFGDISIKANAAYILEYFQTPSSEGLLIDQAIANGTLNSLVEVVAEGDLIKNNGNPELRYSGSLNWRKGNFGAGAFYKHVGSVRDTSVNNGPYDFLIVPSFKTLNLYGDYTFDSDGVLDGTRIRLGVRNVGDEKPPLADEFATGYFSNLHSNRGRYWYGSIRKNF